MSVLIKAEAATFVVRPFGSAARTAAQEPEPAPLPSVADERLEAIEQENAVLRRQLEAAAEAERDAEARGRDEGRREADEAARVEDDRRLEALRTGLDGALEKWRERLDALEALAPLIAHAALAKLFDDRDDYAEMATRMVALQIGRMRRDTIVAVHVSPRDFGDEESLAGLAARLGAGELALGRDPALGPGECRIDLRLGHVDVSVPGQWAQLSSLLVQASQEDAA